MRFALPLLLAAALHAESPRPDGAGLYGVWIREDTRARIEELLPYLRGGQAVEDWSRVERSAGEYDFAALDSALAAQAARGRFATIQINASNHPAYMYERIPVIGKFEAGPRRANPLGHLQYWHPDYVAAYQNLLRAFAAHFKSGPHSGAILGVRLNWNALSTEHLDVPAAFRDPASWHTPPGARPHPVPYTPQIRQEYQQAIFATYLEAFPPEIRIFCRNNLTRSPELAAQLEPLLATGRIGLFHTSTEAEPRSAGVEQQYRAFLRWCRTGKTLAYAEPWADAEGRHGGGKRDPRRFSPCQWNYWMVLANLHCGVSYVAVYGADLARAGDPEFKAAFDLVDRYAGYHASPSVSPGAWVALREGNYLKGDYNLLMERTAGGTPVTNAGPADQRYGAWARRLAAGETMTFRLDAAFARSLAGKPAAVRVIYLDEAGGPLRLAASGARTDLPRAGTGRWIERTVPLARAAFRGEAGDVSIHAPAGGTLHWVEVVRR